MNEQIANELTLEMRRIHSLWKSECKYNGNRFIQMVNQQGGLNTVKALLASNIHPEGLTRLWEEGRLDLSMEATILKAPWKMHFLAKELEVAQKRLDELSYKE